jgi:hypothetical protein
VRVRPPPEYVMPTASKLPDVEIAQARNLAFECLAVRQRGSNPDARHDVQDDRCLDRRRSGLAPLYWAIW